MIVIDYSPVLIETMYQIVVTNARKYRIIGDSMLSLVMLNAVKHLDCDRVY